MMYCEDWKIKVDRNMAGEYQVKPLSKVLTIKASRVGSLMSNYKLYPCFPSLFLTLDLLHDLDLGNDIFAR